MAAKIPLFSALHIFGAFSGDGDGTIHVSWSGIAALGKGSTMILHSDCDFSILHDVLDPLRILTMVAKNLRQTRLIGEHSVHRDLSLVDAMITTSI